MYGSPRCTSHLAVRRQTPLVLLPRNLGTPAQGEGRLGVSSMRAHTHAGPAGPASVETFPPSPAGRTDLHAGRGHQVMRRRRWGEAKTALFFFLFLSRRGPAMILSARYRDVSQYKDEIVSPAIRAGPSRSGPSSPPSRHVVPDDKYHAHHSGRGRDSTCNKWYPPFSEAMTTPLLSGPVNTRARVGDRNGSFSAGVRRR